MKRTTVKHSRDVSPYVATTSVKFSSIGQPLISQNAVNSSTSATPPTGQNGPGRPGGSGAASGGGMGVKPGEGGANMGMMPSMPIAQSVPAAPMRPGTGFGNTPSSSKAPKSPSTGGVNPMRTTSTSKSAALGKQALLGTGLAALLGASAAPTGHANEGMHRGIGRWSGMSQRAGTRGLQGLGIGGALGALAGGAIGGTDGIKEMVPGALLGAGIGASAGGLGGAAGGLVEGYGRAGDYMGAPSYASKGEKADYNKRYDKKKDTKEDKKKDKKANQVPRNVKRAAPVPPGASPPKPITPAATAKPLGSSPMGATGAAKPISSNHTGVKYDFNQSSTIPQAAPGGFADNKMQSNANVGRTFLQSDAEGEELRTIDYDAPGPFQVPLGQPAMPSSTMTSRISQYKPPQFWRDPSARQAPFFTTQDPDYIPKGSPENFGMPSNYMQDKPGVKTGNALGLAVGAVKRADGGASLLGLVAGLGDGALQGRSLNKARAVSDGTTNEKELGQIKQDGAIQGAGTYLGNAVGTLGGGTLGGAAGGLGGAGLGALLGALAGDTDKDIGRYAAVGGLAGGVGGAGLGAAKGNEWLGGKAFNVLKPKHKETDMAKAKDEGDPTQPG
jgi:hypothetical protein